MEQHDDLRSCQMEAKKILLNFHQLCTRFGLRYYLTAGTLLGAVRHQGFIPWDDDIDIAMPRRDYEYFVRNCLPLLDRQYFFQDYRSEPNFPYDFAKIRKRGTRTDEPLLGCIDMEQGIYIDIFPLDRCPDHDRIATLFFKAIELLSCALLAQVSREFVCNYQKRGARFLWRLLSRLPRRLLFALRGLVHGAASLFSSGKRLCTVGGRHGFPRETYAAEWFERTVELTFEGTPFFAPNGWKNVLNNMYGDYMRLPPEEERQRHF